MRNLRIPADDRGFLHSMLSNYWIHIEEEHTENRFWASITPPRGLLQGRSIRFEIEIPANYPRESPIVRCVTAGITHRIIGEDGVVHVEVNGNNILGANWHRLYHLRFVLQSLITNLIQ